MWPSVNVGTKDLSSVRLLTGSSHPKLAGAVADSLGIKLMECVVTSFSNTETRIKPSSAEESTFRGKHIFILQTGSYSSKLSVNDHIMELQLLMDACKRGGCKSLTLIIPCYP